MDSITTKGIICIKDEYNFGYRLCDITYTLNKDESFKYVFTPNYKIIDLLDKNIFDTLPGMDFELRKKEYVRENITPTFISERVPNESRQNYYELLEEKNMDYMDPIEYLIKSKKNYSGDNLYVIKYESKESKEFDIKSLENNTYDCLRKIIVEICKGNDIKINNSVINDNNRYDFYNVLMALYRKSFKARSEKQSYGIEKAKTKGKYKGRKPIKVERLKLLQLSEDVKNKKISSSQAAAKLGISVYKYYRELKKLQNKNDTLMQ